MARSLNATLLGYLQNGHTQLYWWVAINGADPSNSTKYLTFANISSSALSTAAYQFAAGRLMDVSDINYSIDLFNSSLAKNTDCDITFQNVDQAYDPYYFVNKQIIVYVGYGASVTLANSERMFTGRIVETQSRNEQVILRCQSGVKWKNKAIGVYTDNSVFEEHRGKMYPIVYGDMRDGHANMPAIVSRPLSDVPDFIADIRGPLGITRFGVWDDKLNLMLSCSSSDYEGITKQYSYTVGGTVYNPDQQIGVSLRYTGLTTVSHAVDTLSDIVRVVNSSAIDYQSAKTASGGPPAPCVITIDEEDMFVKRLAAADGNRIPVIRGFNGTTATTHAVGAEVKQKNTDLTTIKLPIWADFYANKMSGLDYTAPYGTFRYESGKLVDYETSHTYTEYGISTYISSGAVGYISPVFKYLGGFENAVVYLVVGIKAEITTPNSIPIQLSLGVGDSASRHTIFNQTGPFTNAAVNFAVKYNQTDIPGYSISSLSGINGSNLTLAMHLTGLGSATLKLYQFAITCSFSVPIEGNKIIFRGLGRKVWGGGYYFNGVFQDTIENPSLVIEEFCRHNVPGMSVSDLVETNFDAIYTSRSAWKLAGVIQSE
jgi:hypothetical protein